MPKLPIPRNRAIAVVGSVTAVVALGLGSLGWTLSTPPEAVHLDTAVAELQPTTQFTVEIHDKDGILSDADKQALQNDATRLEVPSVVKTIHYMVFATNRENALDTVEEYSRKQLPEIFTADGKEFVPGTFIIGVGLDPRQSFITGSDDVTAAVQIAEDNSHRQRALDAVKPGVKANNIPAGLFAGAQAAFDLTALQEDAQAQAAENRVGAAIGSGAAAGALTAIAGSTLVARTNRRRRDTLAARDNYDSVVRSYGDVAQRLDAINIRAHSLTSSLADRRLREQWEEVQNKFVAVGQSVDRIGLLTPTSPDKEFAQAKADIDEAASITADIETAEANIDTLYAMEHGDELVRKDQLTALRHDVEDARDLVTTGPLADRLDDLHERLTALTARIASPSFIDEYVELLDDYSHTLAKVKSEKFSDVETETVPEPPALTSSDYRPGYGWNNFIPFWVMSTWHSDAVASSDAGANSAGGYSGFSSGFSAAGGTSSF